MYSVTTTTNQDSNLQQFVPDCDRNNGQNFVCQFWIVHYSLPLHTKTNIRSGKEQNENISFLSKIEAENNEVCYLDKTLKPKATYRRLGFIASCTQ